IVLDNRRRDFGLCYLFYVSETVSMDSDSTSSSPGGVQKGNWSSIFPNVSEDSACSLEWIDSETVGGSKIGKPRCCDDITVKRETLDYARICVEVPAETTYPTTLRFDMGNGKIAVVGVEYSWKPQVCTHCKVFGDMTRSCPNTATWVPKQKIVEKDATQEEEKDTKGSSQQVFETEEVHHIHLAKSVVNKEGDNQLEGAAISNIFVAIADHQEESVEVNNPLAIVVVADEVEPIVVVEECQEGTQNEELDEEVVPCYVIEGQQDMEEVEEVKDQYREEQQNFQLLCKDGHPEQLAQEEPIKEVEVFKDNILKLFQQKLKGVKGNTTP
ncbi:hypothetical protein FRX31_016973, partial [Thalictrum thalictroides]